MKLSIKALTVCQGWASLIFHPDFPKDIENRTWPTSYRGDLLIHSGKSKKSIEQSKEFCDRIGVAFPHELVFGTILGIVELVDCVQDSNSPWAMPDHYHWQFTNPRLLVTPIACKGALSLWTPPDEALKEIFNIMCPSTIRFESFANMLDAQFGFDRPLVFSESSLG